MLTEIKELQLKLEVFDKERQNHLKMKEANLKLQNQVLQFFVMLVLYFISTDWGVEKETYY